eukprot:TRINITY_DN2428_c1_g1_i1.p1 TRINITY_DN2428_c1_g1~~TRINITY_DN2428_c1_g1_i1.p1  ORF type:complete len:414 (-),score=123.99 TRINITY_DN2428_c1_g1_i1:172-1227(-)
MVRMKLNSSPSQTRRPRLALSLTTASPSPSSTSSSSSSSAPVSAQSSWVSYSSSSLGASSAPSSSSSLGQISSLARTTPSQLLRQNAFQSFPSKAQQQARKRLPPFLRQNAHPDLLAFCEMLYPPPSPSSASSSASSPRSPDFGGDFPSPRSAKSSPSSSPCSSPRNNPNPNPTPSGLSPRTKSTPPSPRVLSPRVSSPRTGSPSALSALSASSLEISQPELVYSCNITEYETCLEAETALDVARQVLAMNHQLYKMAGGVMSFDLSTLKEIPPASSSDKRCFTFNVKWVLPMDAFRSGNLECDPNEIANWLQESVPQRSTRLCDFRDLDLSLIRKTLRQAIETLENPPSK